MKNKHRPSDYDVTGRVQVSEPESVREAVRSIYRRLYPDADFTPAFRAFDDFRRLFSGELPGYKGCDTVYHDMQHTLDMTLATVRLIGGYEKAHGPDERLGPESALLGLLVALFHDSGYILHDDDSETSNGAEFTTTHVSRSALFLAKYLPDIGLGHLSGAATRIVHFTGYEYQPDEIELDNPRHRIIGQIVGTADLMAQMADRCYLEKCRDRLYSEFVLGGVAVAEQNGATEVRYESGLDLLRKTPQFYETISRDRLDGAFEKVYRYFAVWFDGQDPYALTVEQNLRFLRKVLETGDWSVLRRRPPVFTSGEDSLEDTAEMVALRLKSVHDTP